MNTDEVPIRYLLSALMRRSCVLVELLVDIQKAIHMDDWDDELMARLDEAVARNQESAVGREQPDQDDR